MSNIMSSAEIILWDLICPVEKKTKKQSPDVEIDKAENAINGNQVRQDFVLENQKKQTPTKVSNPPKTRKNKQEIQQTAIKNLNIDTTKETIKTQLFMVLSSSVLGFTIGMLISFIL